MKITVKTYTVPLYVEVEENGKVVNTLEFKLDYCDSNVFKVFDMGKEAHDTIAGLTEATDTKSLLKNAENIVSKLTPMIDMFAGEGATEAMVKGLSEAYEPVDCMRTVIEVWQGIEQECAERASQNRVKVADKYLDNEEA